MLGFSVGCGSSSCLEAVRSSPRARPTSRLRRTLPAPRQRLRPTKQVTTRILRVPRRRQRRPSPMVAVAAARRRGLKPAAPPAPLTTALGRRKPRAGMVSLMRAKSVMTATRTSSTTAPRTAPCPCATTVNTTDPRPMSTAVGRVRRALYARGAKKPRTARGRWSATRKTSA